MASDCPEPEVCRRCRKEGHVKVLRSDVCLGGELVQTRTIVPNLSDASTAAKKATAARIVQSRSCAESAGNQ